MGDLIFVLPIFIIFFFILTQILMVIKKVFKFIMGKYNLTIDQADQKAEKRTNKMVGNYDQNEVKNRIAEAEKESLAENKAKILNQNPKTESKNQNSKSKKQNRIKKDSLKQEQNQNKNSSLGEIFAQYNELEKAVIYNEILSKPKALKKD